MALEQAEVEVMKRWVKLEMRFVRWLGKLSGWEGEASRGSQTDETEALELEGG
jgi:hypothetical protein